MSPGSQPAAATRVCVIDGDPAVSDSLVTLLTLNGHEAVSFASGTEFLAYVLGPEGNAVHCVICEAELPDTSGLDLYSTLRETHPDVCFALLTSRNDQGAAAEARRHGIDAVFPKPLVHGRLRDFIRRI